jgi:hypothetical protein
VFFLSSHSLTLSPCRRRIVKLKEELGRRINEFRGTDPYNALSTTDEEDDIGVELGLGGLKGLPPTLEYE